VELYHAVLRDDVPKALQFLDLGAKPNEPVGPQGQTAMQMARSPQIIKVLLQFGGDPNVALGTGIRQVSRSIVYISLARGADPNAPIGPQGQTARDWAHTPAKSFLFANFGGNSVALYYNAVLWQDVPEIQRLLALGANLNAPVGLEDETVMDLAHRQENPEILAALAPYEEV
jgi:ankyrin repeat protein